MENRILGLHHITAIAGHAQRNYDFYTKVLGLRLVKKTVNFDDPGTYHFYYGNQVGSPGTILTFFPWAHVRRGRPGTGMATEIGYAVPEGSLEFWAQRLEQHNVSYRNQEERFGEQFIRLEDPDGLALNLIVPSEKDGRDAWTTKEVDRTHALKGFHSVVLTLKDITATAKVLTDLLGYSLLKQEGNRYRFIHASHPTANIVDLLEWPDGTQGINSAGTNHHVAFRVKNDTQLMEIRENIVRAGIYITEKIDRNYFYSLYFREPGGVLFELASDNPGFLTDEAESELGTHLKLPVQYESSRKQIESVLPALQT